MSSHSGDTLAVPSNEPKPGGLHSNKVSSNQQAVAIRYFAGFRRMALTWLGPAYNQHTKEVKSTAGGKGASGASNGHDYFADVAGLLCLGPVDGITKIWMDDDLVWSGNVTRGGTDYATISIPKKGTATIYWGTETQLAPAILAAQGHPPYRGQCYLFFQQLYFGRDKTSAPNIEVELLRQPPANGLATESSWDSDVIPVHCMVELLTSPRCGLAWDGPTTLDLPAWDAAAARLRTEEVGISPLIDRDQDARTMMVQFCEYFDGFLAAGEGGKLALKLSRPHSDDPDDLPLLGEYDLLELPDPASNAWRATKNEVNVSFSDREQNFDGDSEPWRDLANLRTTGGEPLTLNLERPWFTARYQAQKAAAYAGRLNSVPWVSSKITVRKESAVGVEPGGFVRLTYADYDTTLIMRVLSRKTSAKNTQAVELELRADGYFSDLLPYTPDRAPAPDAPLIEPLPPAAHRIIELPNPLVEGGSGNRNQPHLTALVARSSGLDVRFRLYATEDEISYDEVGASERFAIAGTLAEAYPLTPILDERADGMRLTLAGIDKAIDLESTNERGRQRMRLLVFVGDEILSYREAVVVDGGARLLGLRRACYDTLAAAYAAGTPVMVIRRRSIERFTASTFARKDVVDFKIAPATALATLDLATVDPDTLTLANRTAAPLCPINLRVNGAGSAATYASGDDLVVEWDATSWARHDFWQSWDQAYMDDKLHHRVRLCDDTGANLAGFRCGAGVTSYTITNAALVAACGHSEPDSLIIRVFSRRRGLRSLAMLEQIVTKA